MKASGRLSVDTNAVIAYGDGTHIVRILIGGVDVLFLSVVVLGELLYGALSAKPQKNEQVTHKFLAQSILAPIDEAIAIRYATVCLQLKKISRPISENGIRVVTTCLGLGVPPLTRDGHFDHIHSLEVINWRKYEN
jgi:predicted nucleic acid-binding protein